MAVGMSFKDHVSSLVAEHERLESMLTNAVRENGTLRDRLRALGGQPDVQPESETESPSGAAGANGALSMNGTNAEAGQPPERVKLTGNWDVPELVLPIPEGSDVGEHRLSCRSTRGTSFSPEDPDRPQPGASATFKQDTPGLPRRRSISGRSETMHTTDFCAFPPEVWPQWAAEQLMEGQSSPSERLRLPTLPRTQSKICGDVNTDEDSCLQSFVMRPNSSARFCWDMFSMVVLSFDIISIPLEVFSYNDVEDFTMGGMEWTTTTFWTLDIVASFLTGYHCEGLVEMRPSRIASRYLKGGFSLDAVVVLVDWILAIFTFQIKAVIRVGKTARVFRLIRMVRAMRLIRSLKLARLLTALFTYIKSDLVRTLCSIFLMLLVLVVFNHYIACGWYLMGISSEQGWLQAHGMESVEPSYTYMTSLHWSLTQFTPSSMEVFPHNFHERLYTVCVLLFALVTFSSFVSGITSGMMYLRKLKTEPAQQEAILRQYFQESRISAELGQRIWKFLQNNHFQHRKRVHRNDLTILKLVPESLRNKLSEELYLPVVTWNPFLRHFGTAFAHNLNEICHHAVSEKCLTTREELFLENKVAEKMSFIIAGTMDYRHRDGPPSTTVQIGQWACEPVLWMKWTHCGRLCAKTSCELVQLDSRTFRDHIGQERTPFEFASTYATMFREYIVNHPSVWYTDIWSNISELETLVNNLEEDCPRTTSEEVSTRHSFTSERTTGTNGATPQNNKKRRPFFSRAIRDRLPFMRRPRRDSWQLNEQGELAPTDRH